MKTKIILLVVSLMVLGCQSTEPVYNSNIKSIESVELFQYWLPKPIKRNQSLPFQIPETGIEWTYMVTIDSNGREYNRELISSVPEGAMTQEKLEKWPKLVYKPSLKNVERTPVRLEFSIKMEGK